MSRGSETDPFDPLREAPEGDAVEQRQAVDDGGQDPLSVVVPPDASAADVLDQHHTVPAGQEAAPVSVPADANPADVAEQHQVVPLDEEGYDR